ncbi:oligoendopeptidase F [Keratinibaculum paraultunense]|uniref:Oligopeptidase F n=1 Tax=Keratinibaculum paraultunense TaxID=1278232 RepID=A0A4R3KRD0_9FIRM|nr:oligoendopeptidase F [Keratinibaculum paraultunense]QQY78799.1 oligoendopeptidase F [Keratinibaculum paraultunense]TCS87492.1 oligoendopeptidase F [Keratinibaculum paraultunense]
MKDEKIIFKKREDIPVEYTWDLKSMYKDEKEWEEDLKVAVKKAEEFLNYRGKIGESGETLFSALRDRDKIYRIISKVYSYASMKLDEDTRVGESQALLDKALRAYVQIEERLSFVVPEILQIDRETLEAYYEEKEELKLYKHHLDDILRQKSHVLSAKEEKLLAQMGEIANSPQQIYSMLNNADIKFPTIKDEEGNKIEITQSNFIPLMESKNRNVRKAAFEGLYHTYENFKNTYTQTLNGNIKKNIFNAKVRNYNSSIEASLDRNNIPISVYENLINSIHNNLNSMYKYMDIRKRALGVDELHMYDLYTPIVKDVEFNVPYEEGKQLILKGLHPLGEEYLNVVKEGFENRWIDVYENPGKRSGAYSGGAYDSNPYILTNYHNTLDSVFTVAHEMGHSIHSYFSKKNQPFIYAGYSIFVAEVASTANEALLLDYMLKNIEDDEKKLYLLNHYLEQFRTTVYRQTMFAEFEKIIYEYVENGGALTADYLCDTYKKLNEKYYGPNIVVDDEIAIEWARIPHFYYNYYVFQYATGFSAAISISQQILEEGEVAVKRYINFLKSGSSDYPINVLKAAGVDMTTEEPVNSALEVFGKLVDEMDRLI